MAQRVPWDMNEAVIMLNALISAREGRMSRKDACLRWNTSWLMAKKG